MGKYLEQFIERTGSLNVKNINVMVGGKIVDRFNFVPEKRRNQYSVSKSFTSAAVGMALEEGLFSLGDFVLDHFRAEAPENPSGNLKALKVLDLLTMALGQEEAHLMSDQRPELRTQESDWVKYALSIPFTDPPASRFVYNNVGPYLAGVLIQRKAGCNLVDYLMPRLFEPLGISRPEWEMDPQGYTFGAAGLVISLSELSRFGELLRLDGNWNGRQLIPEWYVKEATRSFISVGSNIHPDYMYGYLFWIGPHGSFRAEGMYGQYSIVLKDKKAVICINSEESDPSKIFDAVWETIYSQL